MSDKAVLVVALAADFAARRHADQRRKGTAREPYINHLTEVAGLLAQATGGANSALVAAGLLHDTLEDTETEFEELQSLFGRDVARIVAEVTDDKSLPKAERKRLQVKNTPKKSKEARLVKIADKTSNLRSLANSPPSDWDNRRVGEYIDWAERVVDGCRGLNSKLEQIFDAAAAEARAAIGLRIAGRKKKR